MASEAASVNPIPEHLHTVTPRLVVNDAAAAIDFYQKAFGAQEISERFTGPQGEVIHVELRIGDSVVMLTEDSGDAAPARSPEALGGIGTTILATYWEDVDGVWERAVNAGAEIVYPLADHFYGERGGRLRDPSGHQWMLSRRLEVISREEMDRRAQSYFGSE